MLKTNVYYIIIKTDGRLSKLIQYFYNKNLEKITNNLCKL